MSETAAVVLQRLANVEVQEAVFLYGVEDQVEVMKHELIWIQGFLKDADSKPKGNNRVENWVKELRDVSYLIEDVFDMFLIEVQQISSKEPDMINKLKRLCKKSDKLVIKHELGNGISKIQARLNEISTSKERRGIKDLGESSIEPVKRRQLVVPNIENDIIGFDDDKEEITELLLDQNVLRRHVVSIVGQGGLGKTTLAKKIYNSGDVKDHFVVRIWLNLTFSQEFTTIQLLKDVLLKFREINQSEMNQDEEYFVGEIHKSLSNKKYLVVLDDIRKDNVWSDIFQQVFPDHKNGSRVLITTRFLNIARMADLEGVHKLEFLNNEESIKLLLEMAISRGDCSKCYPPDLRELAERFVKPCGGLPLALVVVGGLLSRKPATYGAWHKVLKSINWQNEGNGFTEIIATGYEDLPLPLKSCFMYLASFPKGYEIEAGLLIPLWVAEGFIPDEAGKIMEDTAENYLEDLAQRFLIQVTERSIIDDSVKSFRVHNLLWELAIREAEEKDLLKIFSKLHGSQNIDPARRATFLLKNPGWEKSSFCEKKLIEYTKSNVRTLIFFGKVLPFDSQFKLLRVLWIENCDYHESDNLHWRNSLKGLLHLRCLVFKYCYFDNFNLPIGYLPNLQTLEISNSFSIEVPMSLWGIKTLRHVSVSQMHFTGGLGSARPDLPNLQTLGLVKIKEPGIESLNMPNLRHLQLNYRYKYWKSIVTLLGKVDSLVSLKLEASESNYKIPVEIIGTREFPSKFPSCKELQTLSLHGQWELKGVALKVDMFPRHLIKLCIKGSHIDQDPMRVLKKLPSLKMLVMDGAYDGKKMLCSKGGFGRLQRLRLSWFDELEEWEIVLGAMPVLADLEISCCQKLKRVPDLRHVPTLNVLQLLNNGKEFNLRAQNKDQRKIEHISSITIK